MQIVVFMTKTIKIDEFIEIFVWLRKFRKCSENVIKCHETEDNEQLSVFLVFLVVTNEKIGIISLISNSLLIRSFWREWRHEKFKMSPKPEYGSDFQNLFNKLLPNVLITNAENINLKYILRHELLKKYRR